MRGLAAAATVNVVFALVLWQLLVDSNDLLTTSLLLRWLVPVALVGLVTVVAGMALIRRPGLRRAAVGVLAGVLIAWALDAVGVGFYLVSTQA